MRTDVLGVEFDNVTMAEAVEAGLRLTEEEGFHYVVTPNPEIVWLARRDPELMGVLKNASLVLPDGIGILYGAKLLGRPLKEKVGGADFAEALIARLAQRGGSVFLFGAKPGVAEKAGENLCAKYPGLVIAGTHDGYFQDDAPILEAIRAAKPQLLLVCLGAPKQEKWMALNGAKLGCPLAIGLGGTLDVYAGVVAAHEP
ncbi:MAG: WecB/TagA/CpsF family glycosyltransferase [bacterium]